MLARGVNHKWEACPSKDNTQAPVHPHIKFICLQIRMYVANLYVYNALNGATLADCSHFQYVSRLRLRVIWIAVKACIDVTLYDEPFITSITEKYFLSPLRIILTVVQ